MKTFPWAAKIILYKLRIFIFYKGLKEKTNSRTTQASMWVLFPVGNFMKLLLWWRRLLSMFFRCHSGCPRLKAEPGTIDHLTLSTRHQNVLRCHANWILGNITIVPCGMTPLKCSFIALSLEISLALLGHRLVLRF